MNIQKLSGYGYIVAGLFIIMFFGGALILQLLGVLAGLFMIHHGFTILNSQRFFRSYFRSFTDIKF